jgi:hypothetical protein
MSTISNTITHSVYLANYGTYASPLTITSTGYVNNPGREQRYTDAPPKRGP